MNRTITAVPAGKDRHGEPLKPRTYTIDRDPEDWGDNRSRIFGQLPLPASPAARQEELTRGRRSTGPLAVVLTDSIEAVV